MVEHEATAETAAAITTKSTVLSQIGMFFVYFGILAVFLGAVYAAYSYKKPKTAQGGVNDEQTGVSS